MNQVECGRNAVWGGCEESLINSHFQFTELADLWREGISADVYASFLENVIECIAHGPSGSQRQATPREEHAFLDDSPRNGAKRSSNGGSRAPPLLCA